MNVQRFQEIASVLLTRHYGLSLNDTHLHDEAIVLECIEHGLRPYEVVAEHADEADLDRIDIEGGYGVPSKSAITAADEDNAFQCLPSSTNQPA